MGCPKCRSTKRRPIAPGYFECLGTDSWGGVLPDGSVQVFDDPCRTRYHAAVAGQQPTLVCTDCTTYAIRNCSGCSRPLCGNCGHPHSTARLPWCDSCESERCLRLNQAFDRKSKAAKQAYLRLPAATMDDLRRWLHAPKGRHGSEEHWADGQTHHFWNIRYEDIALLIEETLGPVERPNSLTPQEDYRFIPSNCKRDPTLAIRRFNKTEECNGNLAGVNKNAIVNVLTVISNEMWDRERREEEKTKSKRLLNGAALACLFVAFAFWASWLTGAVEARHAPYAAAMLMLVALILFSRNFTRQSKASGTPRGNPELLRRIGEGAWD